jgi:D-alanyl-D-alanine carboxypeptidase (penicillin-binding protein 5/6)
VAAPELVPPHVLATRAVVIDADTGAVLWGLREHEPAPMASTVKILTALVTLRLATATDVVTVDAEMAGVGEREIYLEPGEQVRVGDLLAAMLVGSANDAALALAKHVGGSKDGYARVANWLAARLGARDTHVTNPHGLDEPGNVMSAYDLAILARAGLADPVFTALVRTVEYPLQWPGHPYPRIALNKNKVLTEYPGGIGVKTGGTKQAGNCLVGAATRHGRTFVAVALKSANPTQDIFTMLDWAFATPAST